MKDDGDDTILIRRAPRRRPRAAIAAVMLLGLAGSGMGWWLWPAPPAPPAPAQAVALVPAPPPLATEAELLETRSDQPRLVRFATAPTILVVHYPTLDAQGRALNRAAAFLEKKDFPRNRILHDAELDRAIRAQRSTPATFYLGHDYRAADMLRFFALAEAGSVALTVEERELRAMLREAGWREGMEGGALISFAAPDDAAGNDTAARRAILRHELSHGEFFTNPAYAAYVRAFWAALPEPDRRAFTAFLVRSDYDGTQPELMANETQAYLMHTPDPRYDLARSTGLTPERVRQLRAQFREGMPAGWLKDSTPLPRRRPGRPQRRSAVSTRRKATEVRPAMGKAARRRSI